MGLYKKIKRKELGIEIVDLKKLDLGRFDPAVLGVLLLLFSLGSCGDKQNESASDTNAVSKKAESEKKQDAGKTAINNKKSAAKEGSAQGKSVTAESAAVEAEEIAEPFVSKAYLGELPYRKVDKLAITPRVGGPVVLVVIDACNVAHMSAYGYDRETTPNLSKLAKEGIVFANHVSNSSWTRPSFTTIITGLTKNQHQVELSGKRVEQSFTTIAEQFLAAGYKTGGFSGNPLTTSTWGYDQGYQVYEDVKTMKRYFPPDGILVNKALDWVKEVKDHSFFLKVFLTAPHTPYRPPRRLRPFSDAVKEGRIVEYPFREYKVPMPKADKIKTIAAYDDEILYADEQIGRLVKTLKELGVYEKTTFVITGDHGELMGEHNSWLHSYHMWEPALRVPFIVVAPGAAKKGVVETRLTTHVDIFPTLLTLAGIEYDKTQLSGTAITEMLADPSKGQERWLMSQYNAHKIRRQAIRKGKYKLIHHHKVDPAILDRLNDLDSDLPHADPKDLMSLAIDKERFEFYDLVSDPGEKNDLFASQKDSQEVRTLLELLKPELSINPEGSNGKMSKELIEALKNAGYFVGEASK